MAQSNKNYLIEVLKGENYCNWKFRMELILEENIVLDCVTQDLNISGITEEKAKQEKIRKDSKVKSLII